eukprot:TRINITY_DN2639_c0_g1_i1.p2 TRINITY_DN2639_c0_g1~~TRINITY_DN2639_c0_g1_i1.p2  ORF type:complete len:247 (+),score=11.96 TRINITY_DN2639_c0_g1_i1:570-1310(+)
MNGEKYCWLCLQGHDTIHCNKIGGVRCLATGCREDHDKHYCEYCGNDNADHVKSACPGPPTRKPCIIRGCKEFHDRARHFCRVCQTEGADHISSKCPKTICETCEKRGVVHIHGKCDTKLIARTLYHQTDKDHARNIIKEGEFRRGTAGIVGPAIYFSERPEYTTEKSWRRGWIIEAKVYISEQPRTVKPIGDPSLDGSRVSEPAVVVERYLDRRPNIFAIYDNRFITIVDAYPFPTPEKPRNVTI